MLTHTTRCGIRSSEAMNAWRRVCSDDALARVDQDDREVGGRGAGDHVARVLLVARGVGDDELAPRGREVAVGDVDRDPLLALGAQAVGQQRQVQVAVAAPLRGLDDVLELVVEDRLGVVAAAARSASTCRRRPSRRWRSAAARLVRVASDACPFGRRRPGIAQK